MISNTIPGEADMTWGTAMISDICRQPGDGTGFRRRILDTVRGPVSALASRTHSSGELRESFSRKQILGST